MQSGQTSEPYWLRQNETYRDVDLFNESPALLDIYPNGDSDNSSLQVNVIGEHLDEEAIESIKSYLVDLFRLHDDLPLFYEKFRNEKISQAFTEFSGLRLMKASNPFESLICSICSQHSSVEQWNKTIRCIETFFGQVLKLPNGQTFHTFPSPQTLAQASTARLEGCHAGYRAQYILSVSKKIVQGDLNLEELRNASYETAKNELMELPGIGPKVADCFLLYGLGQTRAAPVDI